MAKSDATRAAPASTVDRPGFPHGLLDFCTYPPKRRRGHHSQQFKLTPAVQALTLTELSGANIVRSIASSANFIHFR
jgi:hypothetical protein